MTTKTQLQQKIAELQAQSNPWDGHTALPWKYHNASVPDNTGGYDSAIVDEKGRILAEVFEHVGYDDETGQIRDKNSTRAAYDKRPAEANAAYIVEACNAYPELKRRADMADELAGALDACESALKHCSNQSTQDGYNTARAALAKYREGQS